MTSLSRVCQKCGSEIPGDAPEGGCPGCLLETALAAAGGQTVFGGYMLVKVLGRGGMGIVWLARDEELEHMITEGLGDLDKSSVAERTFKDRHKAGRQSPQPIGYRAAVRSKIALAPSGLTNLVT
jgi:serine/threonine protein kinase